MAPTTTLPPPTTSPASAAGWYYTGDACTYSDDGVVVGPADGPFSTLAACHAAHPPPQTTTTPTPTYLKEVRLF
jgi:hypothetical protein